jgi:hypothetical protein
MRVSSACGRYHNGTSWVATNRVFAAFNGNFNVSGNDGAGHNLNISALDINDPGTYSLGPGNANTAIAQWIDGTGTYSSPTGRSTCRTRSDGRCQRVARSPPDR